MADQKLHLDPKELLPVGLGFALGLLILVFFVLLAMSMDMPLLAEVNALPRQ